MKTVEETAEELKLSVHTLNGWRVKSLELTEVLARLDKLESGKS
jgi:hypothetical protein